MSSLKDYSSSICDEANAVLCAQICWIEGKLEALDWSCDVRHSHGTFNWIYYKIGEPIVFLAYYNEKKNFCNFATFDFDTYKKEFSKKYKKVAFTPRNDKTMKAIVSMAGTYVALSHFAFDDILQGYCVDHIYHEVRFNHKGCVRLATPEQNLRNRPNSKKKLGDSFDYNPDIDFRDNWQLVLRVMMLHELSWEDAIIINKGVRQ